MRGLAISYEDLRKALYAFRRDVAALSIIFL
jgi:hypothetical protein